MSRGKTYTDRDGCTLCRDSYQSGYDKALEDILSGVSSQLEVTYRAAEGQAVLGQSLKNTLLLSLRAESLGWVRALIEGKRKCQFQTESSTKSSEKKSNT